MNNQTSTSPKQKSRISPKALELARVGQWPPEGHPWRALGLLAPEVVQAFFRGEVWAALSEGLSQQYDDAVYKALHAKDLSIRDEARGVALHSEDMLKLESAMKAVHEVYQAVAEEKK